MKDITIVTESKNDTPITPHWNLSQPAPDHVWVKPNDFDPVQDVTRKDPQNPKISLEIGVESRLQRHSILSYAERLVPKKRIPRRTLNCKREPQTYHTVNLATPPDDGFKHVDLIVADFPTLTREDVPKLLVVKCSDTLYLGPTCTINNVSGLLVRKVFAARAQILLDMLEMQTSLQVHPFVPRTFTLQLIKTPFLDTSVLDVFVSEATGDWNLGCSSGMHVLSETEKFVLAYHVLRYLLRAQILALRVLGFTLKRVQPIWRWRSGFRVDLVGCLADTMYVWQHDEPVWGGKEGLATST